MSHWRRHERREARRDERQAERLHDRAVDAALHGDVGRAAALQVSWHLSVVRCVLDSFSLPRFLACFQREARGGSCSRAPCSSSRPPRGPSPSPSSSLALRRCEEKVKAAGTVTKRPKRVCIGDYREFMFVMSFSKEYL